MWDQDIICPNCGTLEEDDNIDIDELQPGVHDRYCTSCGKTFVLNIKLVPVFNCEIKE